MSTFFKPFSVCLKTEVVFFNKWFPRVIGRTLALVIFHNSSRPLNRSRVIRKGFLINVLVYSPTAFWCRYCRKIFDEKVYWIQTGIHRRNMDCKSSFHLSAGNTFSSSARVSSAILPLCFITAAMPWTSGAFWKAVSPAALSSNKASTPFYKQRIQVRTCQG